MRNTSSSAKLAGATEASQPEVVDVGGVSGVLITYKEAAANGSMLEVEDMVVNAAGNTYEIALSAGQADFAPGVAGAAGDPRQLEVGLTAGARRIRRCWCS